MSLLDDIAQEIEQLSDEELAEAAGKIQAQRQKERARTASPEAKARMKEQAKRRRAFNSALLKLAKEKGLVPETETETVPETV